MENFFNYVKPELVIMIPALLALRWLLQKWFVKKVCYVIVYVVGIVLSVLYLVFNNLYESHIILTIISGIIQGLLVSFISVLIKRRNNNASN